MLNLDAFPQLGADRIAQPIYRQDATVEKKRLVAGIQQNLVHPNPDSRILEAAVVLSYAHPGAGPHREVLPVMLGGHRGDGEDTLLYEILPVGVWTNDSAERRCKEKFIVQAK